LEELKSPLYAILNKKGILAPPIPSGILALKLVLRVRFIAVGFCKTI
jgi:hypothetical protein